MKTLGKTLICAILMAAALTANPALASESGLENSRFFVHSTSGILKAFFGVQHEFSDGFTTDVAYGKKSLLKFFSARWGFKIEPVARLKVADVAIKDAAVTNKPTDQTPWGIEVLYDNPLIAKTAGGEGRTVAILGTGVAEKHPALSENVDDCLGFMNGATAWPSCVDSHGSGTHLAGIVAANGGKDGKGIYGLTPQAKIAAYKVCGADGQCWADDIAAGINYSAEKGANIVLLTFAGESSPLIDSAAANAAKKGVLVISPDQVGAIGITGAAPDWGGDQKDLYLPGENIESTWPTDGYKFSSGPAVAAAHLAGLAALVWQNNAEKTLADIIGLAALNELKVPQLIKE